jgi:dihydrofolate reductase
MGRLIVWDIASVDGYFEGAQQWDLRLHEHIWGEDLRRLSLGFGEELGLLVFGRVTYEGMAAHWQDSDDESEIAEYMNAAPKLVASRSLTEATWHNTEIAADIVGELSRRKQADERPIYVFGSAMLTDSLLHAGLVDELLIGLAPVILGAGTPLFKPARSARPLELLEARAIDTGGVLLRYAVPSAEHAAHVPDDGPSATGDAGR